MQNVDGASKGSGWKIGCAPCWNPSPSLSGLYQFHLPPSHQRSCPSSCPLESEATSPHHPSDRKASKLCQIYLSTQQPSICEALLSSVLKCSQPLPLPYMRKGPDLEVANVSTCTKPSKERGEFTSWGRTNTGSATESQPLPSFDISTSVWPQETSQATCCKTLYTAPHAKGRHTFRWLPKVNPLPDFEAPLILPGKITSILKKKSMFGEQRE